MEINAPNKSNKNYNKYEYNNIHHNSDIFDQNMIYEEIKKENSNNNRIKDMTYYNKLINTMNEELYMTNSDNINYIPKSINKFSKYRIYKKEEIKEDNNRLIELENNRQFLLEKNKEIEEQISKLQNVSKKVNYIHEKNNYNYINPQEEIPQRQYASFNYDRNYNYSMDNQNNSVKYSNYSNYSNITQDKNNYIQIEDDSLEFFLDKNKNEKNNIHLYEDINNYYNKDSIISNKKSSIKRKISLSSRNIRQNKRTSDYLDYIRKNKTYNRNKKSNESLRMNIRYNKNKENNLTNKYTKINKSKIKKFGYNGKQNNINEKFDLIKSIINELNNKNINQNSKSFLIDKVNELQIDCNNKIFALKKKYNIDINKKLSKINKLQIEIADVKKKVTKIKSIV